VWTTTNHHDWHFANPTFEPNISRRSSSDPGLDSDANTETTIPFEHHPVCARLVMLRLVPKGNGSEEEGYDTSLQRTTDDSSLLRDLYSNIARLKDFGLSLLFHLFRDLVVDFFAKSTIVVTSTGHNLRVPCYTNYQSINHIPDKRPSLLYTWANHICARTRT
jgi:hypothetical protein